MINKLSLGYYWLFLCTTSVHKSQGKSLNKYWIHIKIYFRIVCGSKMNLYMKGCKICMTSSWAQCSWQEQCFSSLQAFEAFGIVVQIGQSSPMSSINFSQSGILVSYSSKVMQCDHMSDSIITLWPCDNKPLLWVVNCLLYNSSVEISIWHFWTIFYYSRLLFTGSIV